MLKNFTILLIVFYILTYSAMVFAGGFYTGSRNFAFKHNTFSRYNSKHTNRSFAKHKLNFHKKWHHKTKCTNKIYFPYYVYGPYHASYGREDSYTEINIINDKKDEQTEPTVHKDKTFSPPRIVNLEDVTPNKSENVILIRGTKVVETKISSD
jgi:hypothetical protein